MNSTICDSSAKMIVTDQQWAIMIIITNDIKITYNYDEDRK